MSSFLIEAWSQPMIMINWIRPERERERERERVTCMSLPMARCRASLSESVARPHCSSCCRSALFNCSASSADRAWTSRVLWRRWQQASCARVRDLPSPHNGVRTESRRRPLTSRWVEIQLVRASHTACSDAESYSQPCSSGLSTTTIQQSRLFQAKPIWDKKRKYSKKVYT